MQDYFQALSNKIFGSLSGDEILLLNFTGEDSDFTRFNHNKIRQSGHVHQQSLQLDLINDRRQCNGQFNLCGDMQADARHATQLIKNLRDQLKLLPNDPYINFAREVNNTTQTSENDLPDSDAAITEAIKSAKGLDLVGIWASGEMSRGFANSLGQFNWHSNFNFNFDWSVYHQGDKAVKENYAGFKWNPEFLNQKIALIRNTLPLLGRNPVTIKPGQYRVFLAPAALQEIFDLLNWGGFGLKSHRTAQTPLIKMVRENFRLDAQINIVENHREGLTPIFSREGFILPESISLIENGVYKNCLVNKRSAMEYDAEVNCDIEHSCSLQMGGGQLHQDKILQELDTGIYISNLWYCNYSDRNNCRITGMTRFASMWVEDGEPVAPLDVMRFDESVLNILGSKLVALTEEHEHIFDAGSYHQRSDSSWSLPGALVNDFTLTL
jgi:predicted Zn-dependent protease